MISLYVLSCLALVGSSMWSDEVIVDNVTTACEGDVAVISCPDGKMIDIVKALYGRMDYTTCRNEQATDQWSVDCYSLIAINVISKTCDKTNECNVTSGNNDFGDPCPGTEKYLKIGYNCTEIDHPSATLPPTC